MRYFIATFLWTALSLSALGQVNSLFGDDIESGGYGGPNAKVSRLAGDAEFFVGGRGGWIINHRFVLGGAGYALASEHLIGGDTAGDDVSRLEAAYGGMLLEYFIRPEQIVHFTVGSLFGVGMVAVREGRRDTGRSTSIEDSAVFVVEPAAGVVVNIVSFFQLGVEANYRFTFASELDSISDRDISGPSGQIVLRFGHF